MLVWLCELILRWRILQAKPLFWKQLLSFHVPSSYISTQSSWPTSWKASFGSPGAQLVYASGLRSVQPHPTEKRFKETSYKSITRNPPQMLWFRLNNYNINNNKRTKVVIKQTVEDKNTLKTPNNTEYRWRKEQIEQNKE